MTGDRYGGEFPRELFRKLGLACSWPRTKCELFRDFLPLLTSIGVVLPRNDRLTSKSCHFSAAFRLAGADHTHPDHGHDDLANAVAGAASLSRDDGYNWQVHLPGRDSITSPGRDASDAIQMPSGGANASFISA